MIDARTPRFLNAEERAFIKAMFDEYRWSDCHTGQSLRKAERNNINELLRLRGEFNACYISNDDYRIGRQLSDIRFFNLLISL